jgi:signal transduction histidine kinase
VRKLAVLVAPYLPIFLALPVGIHYALGTQHPGLVVLSWIRPGLAILVLARQFVALRDLHRFSKGLESTIQERTSSLEGLQTVLLRNQQMNLLATLGAGVAHDLNNLLSVAMLTTEKLACDLEDGVPPRTEDLDQLQAALGKASGMTAKLMAYGRSQDLAEPRFELNDQLQSLRPMLEQLGGRSVQVTLELAPEPLWLDQDPAQMEQVLLNLTINARDAMPAGGSLRIRTRCAEARKQVILEVADTGTGIPNEILPRLFEPFFTTKQPGKGTGLGLASVKAIVEGCGGQIAIRSQVGQGTTFCLGFPISAAKEADSFLLAGLS